MSFKRITIGLLIVMSLILSACQPTATEAPAPAATEAPAPPPTEAPKELKTVRVGMMPYLDWQPLVVGDKLGYYAEEGIKIEVTYFPDDVTVGEAVENGDVDLGVGNSGSAPLLHSRFKDLVRVGFDATWRGSAIMVRSEDLDSGKFKTYSQFYEEFLKTMSKAEADKKALEAACGQLKGSKVVMDRGTSNAARLAACFPPANLTWNDLTVIDMPDSEGALAFLDGNGNFEMGGFPQVLAIQEKGGKIMVSGVEMGGPSILVSDEFTTRKYLDANRDTIVSMRRVWYKVVDEMYKNPDKVLPILAEIITKASGTNFTPETIWPEPTNLDSIMSQITLWPRLSEVQAFYFDPNSRTNWKAPYQASLDYWVNVNKEVPADTVKVDDFGVEVESIIAEITK